MLGRVMTAFFFCATCLGTATFVPTPWLVVCGVAAWVRAGRGRAKVTPPNAMIPLVGAGLSRSCISRGVLLLVPVRFRSFFFLVDLLLQAHVSLRPSCLLPCLSCPERLGLVVISVHLVVAPRLPPSVVVGLYRSMLGQVMAACFCVTCLGTASFVSTCWMVGSLATCPEHLEILGVFVGLGLPWLLIVITQRTCYRGQGRRVSQGLSRLELLNSILGGSPFCSCFAREPPDRLRQEGRDRPNRGEETRKTQSL